MTRRDARGNIIITDAQRQHMTALIQAPSAGLTVPSPTRDILQKRGWIRPVTGSVKYRLTPVGLRFAQRIRDGEL